jgi:hypothetical protein
MAKGRYTSDLDVGDAFAPMTYEVTPFCIREYCHSVELHQEVFHGGAGGVEAWPVPMVHMEKLRFYHRDCPEGSGPDARIHYEFDATWSDQIKVGDRVTTEGRVARRFTRREREYMEIEVEMRSAADGRVLLRYKDTTVLSYRQKRAAGGAS